jgi:hypothetical protein
MSFFENGELTSLLTFRSEAFIIFDFCKDVCYQFHQLHVQEGEVSGTKLMQMVKKTRQK